MCCKGVGGPVDEVTVCSELNGKCSSRCLSSFPTVEERVRRNGKDGRYPFRRERRVWRAVSPSVVWPDEQCNPNRGELARRVVLAWGGALAARSPRASLCDSVGRLGPVKSGTQIYKSTDKCSELSQPLHIESYKSDRDLVLTQHQTPRIAYTLYAANASSEMQ
jgi:hypothetical protein